MLILASKTTRQEFQEALDYWEDSPLAQRVLKRWRYTPIIPVKIPAKFCPFAGLCLGVVIFINKSAVKHGNIHMPSILLHELRHCDQIGMIAINVFANKQLYNAIERVGAVAKNSNSLAFQFGLGMLSYCVSVMSLFASYSVAEADTRTFVAKALLEKAGNKYDDTKKIIIHDILKPEGQDTTVTETQIQKIKEILTGKTIFEYKTVLEDATPDIRQAWFTSKDAKTYYGMACLFTLLGFNDLFTKTVSAGLVLNITLGYTSVFFKKARNLALPFSYVADKIATITVPGYNPK